METKCANIFILNVIRASIESLNHKYNKQKVILIGKESISISKHDKIIPSKKV